ncbi:MAG TPA: MarR family transcriptional regulator, partial [Gemmatimonadales bacterium]|nr:MarR family transcriptional regulator [Gemmatimonadales bacterium]
MAVRQRMNPATGLSPALEAAVGVLMAADHLQTTFAEVCERHGVTTDQYKVLRILREAPPGGYARGEVADRCIFSRAPDMTRMLDRLVRQGLAKRAPAPGDRRCSIATIT